MIRRPRGKAAQPPRIAGDVVNDRGLGRLLIQHLDEMAMIGRAVRTIGGRRFNLNAFIDFCGERGVVVVSDITRDLVERYQRHVSLHKVRDGSPLSFRSQCELLLAVKAFFVWCCERHLVVVNPAASLKLPRRERRLPKAVLTHDEVELVLTSINIDTASGLRDRAMIEVLYSTGIRRSELRHLKVDDVDAARATLFVSNGKGRKDRFVPIGERALAWLKRYLEEVRRPLVLDDNERALFVSLDGGAISNNRLSEIVKQAIDGSGVDKRGSCHMFRHTAATLMLEAGADIRYIQAMLGHSLLSTTEIYTKVGIAKLQQVHRATHPSAKLARHVDEQEPER